MNTILWSLAVSWEPMIFIGLPILILLSLMIFMVKRYRRCPSNRVLVVYGKVGGSRTARCIHGGGVMVWEGVEDGATFSGRYLRDELVSRGFSVTYVSGEFPRGLTGFDAAFLSFGNAGLDSDGPPSAARLDATWKVDAIQSYLESGGRIFLDGGDTLGFDIYNLVDGIALLPLFGLENAENDGVTNLIDSLDGHVGALTEGMQFTETSQSPVEWIDIFTPSTGAEAFSESDYGVVAVQHRGQYGQRTFCLSYTLAELVDGSTTRADLVDAIVDFFGISPGGSGLHSRRASHRLSPAAQKEIAGFDTR